MTREYVSIRQSGQWLARGMFAAALLSACGQDPAATDTTPTIATADTAAQYAALSKSLQKCQDEQDTCTTAAAGDATKLAACDSEADRCANAMRGDEQRTHRNLRDGAEGCMKARRCQDDDAGADDACHDETRRWVHKHAPALPPCVEDFFVCLDKTGIRQSGGQLTDETKTAIGECVDAAHTCFMEAFRERRRERHGDAGVSGGGHAGAGDRGQGHGAQAGAAAPEAGRDGNAGAGSGRRGQGQAGRAAGFPFAGAPSLPAAGAPGHGRGAAGSDADDDDDSDENEGRGRGRGEGGSAGSRR